jgi:hypothetical protein
MSHSRLIAVPCRISPGVVSDERAFEIRLEDGTSYAGVAPSYYFWNEHGERLTDDEPSGDAELSGQIAGRVIDRQNGTAFVSIPDGSVIQVTSGSIAHRPTEVVIHVPIGPRS